MSRTYSGLELPSNKPRAFAIGVRICDPVEKMNRVIGQQFQIRPANHADVGELRILIERSVRGLQFGLLAGCFAKRVGLLLGIVDQSAA